MSRKAPTQKTRPRKPGAKPVEIPVPKRKDVLDVFRKASKPDRSAADSGDK